MQALKQLTYPTSIQDVVERWSQYEGIVHIEVLPPTRIILIETSCNPAAITAPIPSIFEDYQVRYFQRMQTAALDADISRGVCSNDEEMNVEQDTTRRYTEQQ